jgi:hypothetical protein
MIGPSLSSTLCGSNGIRPVALKLEVIVLVIITCR